MRPAVELLQRRRQFRERYDRLPSLVEERREIEQQIAEADKILAAAEKQHDETIAPLYGRLATIKQPVTDGQSAQRQLAETCDDEELLAELVAVTSAPPGAENRRNALEAESRKLRQWAESDRDELRHAEWPSRIEQLHDRADDRDERAEQMESELVDLRKQIADLERREKAIRERMLVP